MSGRRQDEDEKHKKHHVPRIHEKETMTLDVLDGLPFFLVDGELLSIPPDMIVFFFFAIFGFEALLGLMPLSMYLRAQHDERALVSDDLGI